MERRDVASEEEEEYDSAEEEGSFSPSEDEAEGADATAVSTTEGGAESLQAETDEAKGAHLAQGEKSCCSSHTCFSQFDQAASSSSFTKLSHSGRCSVFAHGKILVPSCTLPSCLL